MRLSGSTRETITWRYQWINCIVARPLRIPLVFAAKVAPGQRIEIVSRALVIDDVEPTVHLIAQMYIDLWLDRVMRCGAAWKKRNRLSFEMSGTPLHFVFVLFYSAYFESVVTQYDAKHKDTQRANDMQRESKKLSPKVFLSFFPRAENFFNQNFTRLLCVCIYDKWPNVIQFT